MLRFVLASKSPRRSFFLKKRGYSFHTFPVEISEILDKNLSLERAIEDLAERKSQALVESGQLNPSDDYLILSADTLVAHRGLVMGKPKDEDEAFAMLRRLSGDTHQVITGYCLWKIQDRLKNQQKIVGHCTSQVEFRVLTDDEIWEYVRSGDPMDKAGAYGIQSLARQFIAKNDLKIEDSAEKLLGSTFRTKGEDFVKRFTGDLENIAGLPVREIEAKVTEAGWTIPRDAKESK